MTERFELLEQLGRGGMGTVWKSRDTETGEVVALKLLHSMYVNDPEYVERFEREVEISQRIDSPHVVKVLGFGRHNGSPFVAMEYVEGPSLREWLRDHGPVSWEETKPIAVQLSQALSAAHRAGVTHRDIKPSNILLGADGDVKLADFGIARAADLTRMTGSVTVLGTPAYMSPDGDANEQSDLYALGCVMYELMAGTPPFEGESQQQVLLKHIREAPELERLPSSARPVVGWLLEKDPGRRPQSADALLAVLRGSSKAPPLSRADDPNSSSGRRHPILAPVLAFGGVALGGIVAAIAMFSGGDDTDPPPTPPPATATVSPFEIRAVDCSPTTVDIGGEVACEAVVAGVDGTEVEFSWAAANGSPAEAAGRTFRTAFAAEGERQRVILKVCRADGTCLERSAFVSVNDPSIGPPPDAAFNCAPNPVRPGETVACSALIGGDDLEWNWTAPGGSPAEGAGQAFSTKFGSTRTNEVSLTICRIVGEQKACGTAKQSILLAQEPTPTPSVAATKSSGTVVGPTSPPPPVIASVLCTPATPKLSERVTCTANVSGAVDSRSWIASGGAPASASGASLVTSFAAAGPKTILLEVCGSGGCATSATSVAVSDVPPPEVSLICTPGVIFTGSPTTCITSVLSGAVTSWSWNAPTGNPATGAGPGFVTTYNTYGNRTITLVACEASSCTTVTANLRVDPPWATPSGQQPGPAPTSPPLQPTPVPSTPAQTSVSTVQPTPMNTALPTPHPTPINTPVPTPVPTLPPTEVPPQLLELSPNITVQIDQPGQTYFTRTLSVAYGGSGAVILGGGQGLGPMGIDDRIEVTVRRPSGQTSTFSHTFSSNCVGPTNAGPFDLTHLFGTGTNEVTVRLSDLCGFWGGGGATYLGVGY